MNNAFLIDDLLKELVARKDLEVFQSLSDQKRFSKDFFDYSPILKEELSDCIANLVVRPQTIEAAAFVASGCYRYGIPMTLRGSGTGNYGQCVPLQGGVVMLMNGLKKIRNFNSVTGEITVEAGCLLRDVNEELNKYGRQLRLLPSTWRSASIGGFIAGGSGGIGSVRWGFLRDPGHLSAVELMTVESSPQILQLDASSSEPVNHAYGTNGIITALTITSTLNIQWHEVVVDCAKWDESIQLMKEISCSSIELYLCTLLENQIVDNLPNWSGESVGKHRILCLVAPDGVQTIRRLSHSMGCEFNDLGPENLKSGTGLRELSWNHTTLHMRGVDENWTYLQMLLPQAEVDMMKSLKQKWGDSILWHLEGVRQYGQQRIASLPLVKWEGKKAMDELITDCKELGALIFNPHVITVEDGGLGVIDANQVKAKHDYDPKAILNPGKLKGWLLQK